jgi:hypothetical protein
MVDSHGEIDGRITKEARFITSLVLLANAIRPMSRLRTQNAPANYTTLKYMAHTWRRI